MARPWFQDQLQVQLHLRAIPRQLAAHLPRQALPTHPVAQALPPPPAAQAAPRSHPVADTKAAHCQLTPACPHTPLRPLRNTPSPQQLRCRQCIISNSRDTRRSRAVATAAWAVAMAIPKDLTAGALPCRGCVHSTTRVFYMILIFSE